MGVLLKGCDLCGVNSRKYNREYHLNRYHRKRKEWLSFLGGSCTICGDTTRLEIDHVDSSLKKFDFSTSWGRPKKEILEELNKCQCLCHIYIRGYYMRVHKFNDGKKVWLNAYKSLRGYVSKQEAIAILEDAVHSLLEAGAIPESIKFCIGFIEASAYRPLNEREEKEIERKKARAKKQQAERVRREALSRESNEKAALKRLIKKYPRVAKTILSET